MALPSSSIFVCPYQANRRHQGFAATNGAIAYYLGETDQLPIGDRVNLMEQRLARLKGKGWAIMENHKK